MTIYVQQKRNSAILDPVKERKAVQAEVAAGSFSGFCSIVASGCGACAAVKPLLLRAVPVACAGQQSV